MTTSRRMEEDRSHMTEKILNLTLEIIYLLTGESCPPLKDEGQLTFTVPPPRSLMLKRDIEKKILEVIKKMMELLTGEVPIRCQDVSVYFSMEEWEYLGGHRDLYKDVVMENEPPLTSPDGSRKRNPPERCPRPLYSRDSTQEDHTYAHHYEGEEQFIIKVEVKEEEEKNVGGGHQPNERDMVEVTIKEEDNPTETFSDESLKMSSEDHQSSSPKTQNRSQVDTQDAQRDNLAARSPDPSNAEESNAGYEEDNLYSCPDCGKWFCLKSRLNAHMRYHMAEKPYPCSVCGKGYLSKAQLVDHQRVHTGEKPFSCSDCGKTFSFKGNLVEHQRRHLGESHTCSVCGKSFLLRTYLVRHLRFHTGEKLHPCSECGKSFVRKSELVVHQRYHTGEKPYSCPECGKSFVRKCHLGVHLRFHTGDKPFSCPQCGKSFARKSDLAAHEKTHKVEKPVSCLVCGKYFARKVMLARHRRTHRAKNT